jgi:hypothetical protein
MGGTRIFPKYRHDLLVKSPQEAPWSFGFLKFQMRKSARSGRNYDRSPWVRLTPDREDAGTPPHEIHFKKLIMKMAPVPEEILKGLMAGKYDGCLVFKEGERRKPHHPFLKIGGGISALRGRYLSPKGEKIGHFIAANTRANFWPSFYEFRIL